jgi:hypothetical protein
MKGDLVTSNSPPAIAHACLQAYVDKERAAIERSSTVTFTVRVR